MLAARVQCSESPRAVARALESAKLPVGLHSMPMYVPFTSETKMNISSPRTAFCELLSLCSRAPYWTIRVLLLGFLRIVVSPRRGALAIDYWTVVRIPYSLRIAIGVLVRPIVQSNKAQ